MRNIRKVLITTICMFVIILCNINVYAENEININAKAGLMVEKSTGKIIYEKASEEKKYPASVTKILTAIIVIENCKLDDVVTVSHNDISQVPTEYVVTPLIVGEEMKVEDLLYAMLLKSANDAAYALAEHVGGSVDGFAKMMNEKAKQIGCKSTNFVNPNGLHNVNHYTTAYDLYLISKYAMQNETFAKIVSTYQYTLSATNKYKASNRVITNTNLFIDSSSQYYDKNVKGIKTGTTNEAGNCLITDVEKDGLEFFIVVLGADTKMSKFSETKKMIDYAYNNYTFTKLHEKGDKITEIDVEKATDETKRLSLAISDDVIVMNNVKIKKEDMIPEIKLNENITAPISIGQELGTITYNIDGNVYTAKLLAINDVSRKYYNKEICITVGSVLALIVFLIVIKKSTKKRR